MTEENALIRRRSLRLSVRFLLLLVVVVGVPIGWYAYSVRVQRLAVAALLQSGGQVIYDWQWNAESGTQEDRDLLGWRRWVADRIGHDWVATVKMARLQGRTLQGGKVSDELMAHIGLLRSLENINLNDVEVDDSAFSHVANLGQLRKLDVLSNAGLTGDCAASLRNLRRLRYLALPTTKFADSDLPHLAGLKDLEWLSIQGDGVTDRGIAALSGLTKVRVLNISRSSITAKGLGSLRDMADLESLGFRKASIDSLAPIAHLRKLQSIGLEGNPLDDAGLAPVAQWPTLQHLGLDGTRVTDAGMAYLDGLNDLQSLSLIGTSVTDAGTAYFAERPKLVMLHLERTKVGDAGMANVAACPSLSLLWMDETGLTDAGLEHFARTKSCYQLTAKGTKITDAGVAALQKALPTFRVHR